MRRPVATALAPLLAALLVGGLLLLAPVSWAATPPIDNGGEATMPAARGTVDQVDDTMPPPDTGTGRRAIYSITQQRVWVVDANEAVVRTFLVSGRLDQPNPGTYTVWSRSMYACSASNHTICMRYMIRFAKGSNGGNIGFHEIPRYTALPDDPWVQTDEQLGQPISDGCLRQATADAQFMWDWAPLKTKVVVIP